MVIENENERPALELKNKKKTERRRWMVYNTFLEMFGSNGFWYDDAANADAYDTIGEAQEAIRRDYPGCTAAFPAFVEIETTIRY